MSKYPKTSVVDIAMGILKNMDPKTSTIDTTVNKTSIRESVKDPNVSDFVPDIKDTNVSDDYISNILEGSMGIEIEKKSKKIIKENKQQKSKNINEDKVADLISRLSSLLAEAKEMINDMTTVGMIGTNLSNRKKTKFKK